MRDASDLRRLNVGNHRMPCPEYNRGPKDTALSIDVRTDGSAVWVCFRCGWKGGQRGDPERTVSVNKSGRSTPTYSYHGGTTKAAVATTVRLIKNNSRELR